MDVLVEVDEKKFDTALSTSDEIAFQKWKREHAPNDSGVDYDLRGAFLAGLLPTENGHWSDAFKKPNHPTFSNESVYAKSHPELAGYWVGDQFVSPEKGLTYHSNFIALPYER